MRATRAGTLYEDSDEDRQHPNLYTIPTEGDVRLREIGSLAENTTLEPVMPEVTMRAKTGVFSYTLLRVYYAGTNASAIQGRSNAALNPGLNAPSGIYWFRQDKLSPLI